MTPSCERTLGTSRPNACNCWSRLNTKRRSGLGDAADASRPVTRRAVTLFDDHHSIDVT